MATTAKVEAGVTPRAQLGELVHISWLAMANGDVGDPVSLAEFADKSITVEGTWGGGTLTMQGSNDLTSPSKWFSLTDPQGNAVAKTADAMEQLMEQCVWIRPSLAGGAAGAVNVKMLCRRGRGRAF